MPGVRGQGVGGYMSFKEHGDEGGYGCCAAIGAAGLALIPLTAIMQSEEGVVINHYLKGQADVITPAGAKVQLIVDTSYPVDGNIGITINMKKEEAFEMKVRIPGWSVCNTVTINGEPVKEVQAGTYLSMKRIWRPGDTVTVVLDVRGRVISAPIQGRNPNGKYHVAIQRGPVVMARDVRLQDGPLDQVVDLDADENGYIVLQPSNTATFNRNFEFKVPLKDGSSFLVIDGASAGKTWNNDSMMSVWLPTKQYWETDINAPVTFWFAGHQSWKDDERRSVTTDAEGRIVFSIKKADLQDDTTIAVQLEPAGEDYYRIRRLATGNYFTVDDQNGKNGSSIYEKPFTEQEEQLWKLERIIKDYYKIQNAKSGKVLTRNDRQNVCLWEDTGSDKQFWAVRKCR